MLKYILTRTVLLLAALLMVIMPNVAAAEDNFETAGTIEAVSATSISVNGESISITNATSILLNGTKELNILNLKTGMYAIVEGISIMDMKFATSIFAIDSTNIVTRVEAEGKISDKTDSSLTVNNFKFIVNSNTSVYLHGDSSTTYDSLKAGMDVLVKGYSQAGNNYALLIKVEDRIKDTAFIQANGVITSATDSTIEVEGKTFFYDSTTEILFNGQSVNKSELKVGTKVVAYGYYSNNNIMATNIIILEKPMKSDTVVQIKGSITDIKDSTITVDSLVFHIAPNTQILIELLGQADLSMLKVGNYVSVTAHLQNGVYTASQIMVNIKISKAIETEGTISALTDSTITVNNVTFILTNQTYIILEDSGSVDISALKVGQDVEINGYVADSTNLAITIQIKKTENHVIYEFELKGVITAITGDTIEVNNIPIIITDKTVIVVPGMGRTDVTGLKVGDNVRIDGFTQDSVNYAKIVKVNTDGFDIHLNGKITIISDSLILVNHTLLKLNGMVKFYENNKPFENKKLKSGMFVRILADYNGPDLIIYEIIILHEGDFDEEEESGEIEDMSDSVIVVGDEAYFVDMNTEVYDENGQPMSYYNLQPHQRVFLTQDMQDNNLYASKIMLLKPLDINNNNLPVTVLAAMPNIFGNSTVVRLVLDKPTIINLNVYDQTGSIVTSIYNGVIPGGTFNFVIGNGNNFNRGMYFVTLQTDDGVYTVPVIKLN